MQHLPISFFVLCLLSSTTFCLTPLSTTSQHPSNLSDPLLSAANPKLLDSNDTASPEKSNGPSLERNNERQPQWQENDSLGEKRNYENYLREQRRSKKFVSNDKQEANPLGLVLFFPNKKGDARRCLFYQSIYFDVFNLTS